jgi:pilus assembly protein CpaB
VSETVITDIRVLAIDQTTDDKDGKPVLAKTVTFEVTPKQVEAIQVASELGRLSLSLRSLAHRDDVAALPPAGVSHTWDSDVSPLLQSAFGPANAPAVTVLRGDGAAPARPAPGPATVAAAQEAQAPKAAVP